jgi:hypothetical protein
MLRVAYLCSLRRLVLASPRSSVLHTYKKSTALTVYLLGAPRKAAFLGYPNSPEAPRFTYYFHPRLSNPLYIIFPDYIMLRQSACLLHVCLLIPTIWVSKCAILLLRLYQRVDAIHATWISRSRMRCRGGELLFQSISVTNNGYIMEEWWTMAILLIITG